MSVPQTDSRNLHCLMRLLAFVVELMSKLVARYAHALCDSHTPHPWGSDHRHRRNPLFDLPGVHDRRDDSLYTCASSTYAETLACYHTTAIRWAIKSGASLREPCREVWLASGAGQLPAQNALSTAPCRLRLRPVPSSASCV